MAKKGLFLSSKMGFAFHGEKANDYKTGKSPKPSCETEVPFVSLFITNARNITTN